jgi:hypothetical protein
MKFQKPNLQPVKEALRRNADLVQMGRVALATVIALGYTGHEALSVENGSSDQEALQAQKNTAHEISFLDQESANNPTLQTGTGETATIALPNAELPAPDSPHRQ